MYTSDILSESVRQMFVGFPSQRLCPDDSCLIVPGGALLRCVLTFSPSHP